MILFENKAELVEFFEFIADRFNNTLTDSSFEVNLSIIPIDRNNLESIGKAFEAYQRSKQNVITPANGVLKK